jgi:hypothetical protein
MLTPCKIVQPKERVRLAFNSDCKVMHDDVESGKSLPHWQGDFLSISLPGLTPTSTSRSVALLVTEKAPSLEKYRLRNSYHHLIEAGGKSNGLCGPSPELRPSSAPGLNSLPPPRLVDNDWGMSVCLEITVTSYLL